MSVVYDMLLPYILTDGALGDDDLGLPESGNGIPDLLDEARNEVDFWLRLRDGEGYSHGVTNPNKKKELFQAAPTAVAAWANAAMLADCFRLAGERRLMAEYRDAAIAAYAHADRLTDRMLGRTQSVGNSTIRGRDFKMTAAAYLYNVTGRKSFEDDVKVESVCTGPESVIDDCKTLNQVWATAGYLKTRRRVHYPELLANMKASIIHQARESEAGLCKERPTRRATNKGMGYFQTAQNVHASLVAHAVADDDEDRAFFLNALALEADYGLGRNPLNMIQMTTATTELADRRSVLGAYTSGRNDGSPGLHPGHIPYMNLDDWYTGMTMGTPSKLHGKCYPGDFKRNWPIGEGYFDTRYVWAHNEFTPQQTMRGKMALYGYLYGIAKRR
ncbi:MAG: glycoside hydrolase family 9 protein [Planctomycetota bacterium]